MINAAQFREALKMHHESVAKRHQEHHKDRVVTLASSQRRAHTAEPDRIAALYVATNLKTWQTEDARGVARDLGLNGHCYRRLDPMYYAWLREQAVKLKNAFDAGKVSAKQFEHAAAQYRTIHAWALAHFGEAALNEAVATFEKRTNLYRPPSMDWLIQMGFEPSHQELALKKEARRKQAYLFPSAQEVDEDRLPFWTPVTTTALAKVRAIEAEALAKGWSRAALFQNRGAMKFPVGTGYGLVCFVKPKDRIGKVTETHIEILKPPPGRSCLRFVYAPVLP